MACVGVLVFGVAEPVAPSFASSQVSVSKGSPVVAGSDHQHGSADYLALGDSVSFGFREGNTLPPPNYADAASFIGYPEDVAAALGLNVANAACPGETSESLIAPNVPSNGCENSPEGGPGYRATSPLHVNYSGTQLQFAVRYLRTHPDTRLVTLMIGANDVFLCETNTKDACASELPTVVLQISTNVADILRTVRHDAHYRGQIILVNYYTLNYADPNQVAGANLLNAAMDAGGQRFHVQIADGFGALQAAAAQSGGDSCTAGLLTQEVTKGVPTGCGIHPSLAGQGLLALAVADVVRK
jgi:lysophospholipase L1-like esterase